ncbi:hypothetical protein [Nonomuraea sp. NPDC049400]|uniref:hypothetical protein n=1 Tax=Nonomuraea sp. NPDC049400 TaxID=3364352 RepID=UPI003798A03C
MADTSEKTIADELREAAAKLREKAENAPHGPWHWEGTYPQRISNAAAIVVADTFTGPEVPPYGAEWITLVSPELAEPLASWLEKAAKDFDDETYEDAIECPACGDGCYKDHGTFRAHSSCGGVVGSDAERCPCFDEALAVARFLNGTAS